MRFVIKFTYLDRICYLKFIENKEGEKQNEKNKKSMDNGNLFFNMYVAIMRWGKCRSTEKQLC